MSAEYPLHEKVVRAPKLYWFGSLEWHQGVDAIPMSGHEPVFDPGLQVFGNAARHPTQYRK